jgi:uncharacterized membrane protein
MNSRDAARTLAWLALGGALIAAALYPWLPERLPIHWDWRGHPDGWGDRSWAAFLGPLFLSALQVPLRLRPGQRVFPEIFLTLGILLTHVHLITLLSGLFPEVCFARVLLSGLFGVLALLGNVLGKVRRNPWVGIRTPWTLADERVWILTHRRGARLLALAGLGGAVLSLLGLSSLGGLVLLTLAVLESIFYSYRIRKETP